MWFWQAHGCNEIADCGQIDRCTKIINGGYTGLGQRSAMYNRAQQVFA
jgi:putative chitinase